MAKSKSTASSRVGRLWSFERLEDRIVPSSLPLSFEPNVGQTDPQVQFLSRGQGYGLFLTANEAVLNLFPSSPASSQGSAVLRTRIVGANGAAAVTGVDALGGKANYFIGNDPSQWHTNIPLYGRVQYQDIYPGIDLIYYGTAEQKLEYDFVVAPGVDPGVIRFAIDGADGIALDAQGNLVLHTGAGDIVQHAPVMFQDIGGSRHQVAGSFALDGNQVRFQIGAYNPQFPLTIDPVMIYATYQGGSGADDAFAVTTDNTGAYVTGFTRSADFPTTAGTYDRILGGSSDAFVTKLNPAGTALAYSTYFGGSGRENDFVGFGGSAGVAVDGSRNVYLTGLTTSSDFPVQAAYQATLRGTQDAFVVKLNSSGSGLLYSTYLGGTGDETGASIALDGTSNAYVAGWTSSTDFPVTAGVVRATSGGGVDGFLTKLNSAGSTLTFSTYLGGSGDDYGLDLALAAGNNVVVTGRTLSSNFPTAGGLDNTLDGSSDAFVTKVNPAGTGLVYSTYLGGGGDEDLDPAHAANVGGVAIDTLGNVYVTGSTSSGDFPLLGPMDNTLGGVWDAFVTKLTTTGNTVYSTYLGGSGNDVGMGIAVNTARNAYITGYTESGDFTLFNPIQFALAGSRDAYMTVLNPSGFALAFSSYMGGASGSEGDIGRAITVDNSNQAFVVGYTDASDFPTQTPQQAAAGGAGDAFIAKMIVLQGVTVNVTGSGTDVTEGLTTDTYTLVLNAPPTANVVITVTGDAQATVAPGLLTFTPANWSSQQTITVTAVDDLVPEGNHTGIITHTVSSADANYQGAVIANQTANITDNDIPGVTVSQGGSHNVSETGPTAYTYRVMLTSPPTAPVVITPAPDSQGTVSPADLTFTAANWNTWQNVTITAIDDGLVEASPHNGIVTSTATSADSNYNGIAVSSVTVYISDNDTPGVIISGGNANVTEGAATDSYTIVLKSQPAADVVITITVDTQETVSPALLTFTAANWSTSQRVTVTAVDDSVVEGTPHSGTITHTASSADANYNGLAVNSKNVNITDNDTPGVFFTRSGNNRVNETGPTSDIYYAQLASPPSADVILTVTPDVQINLYPIALTFTAANWNTLQTVTVTAVDDGLVEAATHNGIVTHTASSVDPSYNGLAVANVTFQVTDNDVAGVIVTQTSASTDVTEGGLTDIYSVRLNSLPTSNVVISLNPGTQLAVVPAALTFTATNWNTPQTVNVTAIDDFIAEGPHGGSITHSATSVYALYNGISIATITANITDNDSAGVIVTQTGGSTDVAEGGATDSFTMVLNSQPIANVTVTLNPGSQLTLSATNRTFTAANWNVPWTVNVTAVDDLAVEGLHTGVIVQTVASADPLYSGFALAPLTASIADNDFPPGVNIVESGAATNVAEGGVTDTYTVVLNSRPLANVVVSFNPGPYLIVTPAPLTFNAGNWNAPQTVLVSAIDDNVFRGSPHTGIIAHTAVSTDANYNGIAVASVTAIIQENDPPPGVNLSETGGSTNVIEGGATDSYSVTLNSAPTASVIITLNPGAQLTALPPTLTFTPGNWNTPQMVVVRAIDDSQANPSIAIITHSAASGDPAYNGIAIAPLTVNITENDFPAVLLTETNGPMNLLEGATQSYTLRLNSRPTADVTISLAGDSQAAVSPASITFSTADWNVPRPVIVSALLDGRVEGLHVGVVRHTAVSTDPAYNGMIIPNFTAQIIDNDGSLVQGTSAPDQIIVSLSSDGSSVLVSINGSTTILPAATSQIHIDAGGGADNIQITNLNIPVMILGGSGSDQVFVTGQAGPDVFALGTSSMTLNGAGIGLWEVENLIVNGQGGSDLFTVRSVPAMAVNIKGELGADQLIAPDADNVWAITGPGTGTLNRTVSYTGLEKLTGGSAGDAFLLAAAKVAGAFVDGGGGNDMLDYSQYTSPVTVNLQTGAATGTTGFTNINRILGGKGADQLAGLDQSNQWNITGPNAGDINGIVSFQGIESLQGGQADDIFFVATVQGIKTRIDGAAGNDRLDYSRFPGNVAVNLQARTATAVGSFANFENLVGSPSTRDTLIGTNKPNTWTLTGANAGIVSDGLSCIFEGMENLTGGTGSDTFQGDGLWTGLLNAGTGIDTLVGSTSDHLWNITGLNAGALDGRKFTGVENLKGNAGADQFTFNNNQKITGKIDGGTGIDLLNLAAYTSAMTINLATGAATGSAGFSNIEQFRAGSAKSDTLLGPNLVNLWSLTALNAGSVNGLLFSSFENLSGGGQNDVFSLSPLGDWTGTLNGGAGTDTLLAFPGQLNSWSTATLNGRKFAGIEVRK